MLKDITLGQYFPGDTLAHKLDPRTKLLVTVLYIVALFTAKSYLAYGLLVLTLVVAVHISRVSVKALFKGLKPVLFIIAFTAVLNLFYTPGREIWHFWIFRMTIEGVRAAVTMMLRITLLIMGTFLLTYTTSPIRLTDGLENLLGPLKAIKLPVHELAMMMSIALRFIPTLIEETDKIMSAQKARGAETLFVPAGWVQGENKLLHWRTLLCARAIENGLTVLGADQYAPGKFVGHSMAFQPDGTALGELGEEQDLLIVKIN